MRDLNTVPLPKVNFPHYDPMFVSALGEARAMIENDSERYICYAVTEWVESIPERARPANILIDAINVALLIEGISLYEYLERLDHDAHWDLDQEELRTLRLRWIDEMLAQLNKMKEQLPQP